MKQQTNFLIATDFIGSYKENLYRFETQMNSWLLHKGSLSLEQCGLWMKDPGRAICCKHGIVEFPLEEVMKSATARHILRETGEHTILFR